MREKILRAVKESIESASQLLKPDNLLFIEESARMMASCFFKKNKVLIAGNGGSLCDASHFAEELTGFFREKRMALPAIALSEPGHLTCVGNDLGFEYVFSRAIEAYATQGDLFIGMSTSGNSMNLVNAFLQAKKLGLNTIAFLGKGGGKLKSIADLELLIEDFETSDRIQEAHMTAAHIIIEMVEKILFSSSENEVLEEAFSV